MDSPEELVERLTLQTKEAVEVMVQLSSVETDDVLTVLSSPEARVLFDMGVNAGMGAMMMVMVEHFDFIPKEIP